MICTMGNLKPQWCIQGCGTRVGMEMISKEAPAFSIAATDRRDPQIWNNGEPETPVVPAMLVQAFKKGALAALTGSQ